MTIKFPIGFLLLGILACFYLPVRAQMDDWQLRSQVGLTYSPAKRWDLNTAIRYDRNQSLMGFRRTNITIGSAYQAKKHLQVGIAYRFMTSYQQDVHRFRIFATADKKINKKWSLTARTLLQHDIKHLQWEYLKSYNPLWVLRERVTLKYDYSKKWKLSVYTEPFVSYQDAEIFLYRIRTGIQANYTYKKRHEIGGGFFWQHGMAQNAGQNIGVFTIQYTFDLNKPKAKKKKKTN